MQLQHSHTLIQCIYATVQLAIDQSAIIVIIRCPCYNTVKHRATAYAWLYCRLYCPRRGPAWSCPPDGFLPGEGGLVTEAKPLCVCAACRWVTSSTAPGADMGKSADPVTALIARRFIEQVADVDLPRGRAAPAWWSYSGPNCCLGCLGCKSAVASLV